MTLAILGLAGSAIGLLTAWLTNRTKTTPTPNTPEQAEAQSDKQERRNDQVDIDDFMRGPGA